MDTLRQGDLVAPREGRVSRNPILLPDEAVRRVAPREGRVSRNYAGIEKIRSVGVAPREGRVSRNYALDCPVN